MSLPEQSASSSLQTKRFVESLKPELELAEKHEITHFGGAPIVLNMLANAPAEEQKVFERLKALGYLE